MSHPDPTIVVVAYDRPHALRRLLTSLDEARYAGPVRLVISVDRSESGAVAQMAEDFEWRFGDKRVIAHSEHLGLRAHILRCGDLTTQFGSVIVLEDDLFVSPFFYEYTVAALARYGSDPGISGISLYGRQFNETASLAFMPLNDGSDVFFMQLPSSWGQCWTADQWERFRLWYRAHERPFDDAVSVPSNVMRWPDTSWAKYFVKYMIDGDTYFVYPRQSLTTNFGEPGVHVRDGFTFVQVPLQMAPRSYVFKALPESDAVYDAHCEIVPDRLRRLAPDFAAYDFDVDLYGAKELGALTRPYVLTSRKAGPRIQGFALALKPHEMNVVHRTPGKDVHLVQRGDHADKCAQATPRRVAYYHNIPESRLTFRASRREKPSGRLEHLEAKLRSLEARHRDLRRRYQAVVASKAWILTRPFRTAGRYLARFRSGSA